MTSDETPSRYPYLISVRGGRPVPARKDGRYYVCAYQTFLGLWWPPREVAVLAYDPHRDFYREQRQAQLDAHATTPDAPAVDRSPAVDAPRPAAATPEQEPEVGTTEPGSARTVVWERVNTRPAAGRPAPTWDPARAASRTPGWGR